MHRQDEAIKSLLSQVIHENAKKREQIADELSVLAGRKVSVNMIDAYCAPCKESNRLPADLIEPLAVVTGDDRLQRLVMGPKLRNLVEFAETEIRIALGKRKHTVVREKLIAEFSPEEGETNE